MKKQDERFKSENQKFKELSLFAINAARPLLEKHGDWRDWFNNVISLISSVFDAFKSLKIHTKAGEFLQTLEYNISVAQEKSEKINLHSAEYYGLIDSNSFKL